jgi:hypothetical protein
MPYKKVMISNRQCFIGTPPLQKTAFLSLNIGDKVSKIGEGTVNGIETSSNRFDYFKKYAIYRGVYLEGKKNYLVFELPDESVLGFDLFKPEEKVFLAYSFYNDSPEEIYQSIPTEIRIYKSVFTLA